MRKKAWMLAACAACGAGTVGWAGSGGAAEARFPNRPVRVIVPFAPGGGSDVLARLLGPRLAERLGQPVVVDNRPAASGVVGADLVAKANPDGHTLLLVFSTHAQSAQLFTKLPFDPLRDFAPITLVISTPLGMLLHPAVPARTVQEFIAHARANPGKLNYGSSGPGSSPHLATELFSSMAGIRMTHLPYKGVAPVIAAQLANEVQFAFSNMFSTMGHWKAGRLRLVAHAGARRVEGLPEIPTIAESGVPGFDAYIWYGYLAPAKTPRAIVERLRSEIVAVVDTPEIRQTLVAQGNEVVLESPAAFAKRMAAEAEKWGAIGRKLGVRLD